MLSRSQPGFRRASGALVCRLLLIGFIGSVLGAGAAELEVAKRAFTTGQYDQCIALAKEALEAKEDAEDWGELLTQALLIRGRYAEALTAATNALAIEERSIRLRWVARQALLFNNQPGPASELTREIQELFTTRTWSYRDPRDLVVFGRVALMGGIDPKMLLDRFYNRVKQASSKTPEIHLACGDLALEKHDYKLAARFFHEGLKEIPDHPDLHFGLARAYAPSDQKLMLTSLMAALDSNTNHVPTLLLLADHDIDAEDYAGAERLLDQVQAINPDEPEAWAYRAVIAHLKNKPKPEAQARERALKSWRSNPRVDYLIGLKLSQKYRFAVGASHQRQALAYDPDYLPAKSQLAQDLLRLAREAEGWRLADEVQRQDGYDVAANNLVTLHGVIKKYETLTNENFHLRLHPREAALYGRQALDLLENARKTLCPKYGVTFSEPVLIEMFHEEKDFAVRTFGMPDNDGFLGVCFGPVITANSPAAKPGGQFNWQSMLWHEFCHVITLQLTKNKMPRWLSEGISVYEERQANPAWGERINPRYREMLLGKDFVPLSALSGAFLAPKSALHLQFAYYESSLAVQFVVERFGREKLVPILRELGAGVDINDALAQHTLPLARLEKDFESYARGIAEKMAPGVDWESPKPEAFAGVDRVRMREDNTNASSALPRMTDSAWELWSKLRPTNYYVMVWQAQKLVEQEKWAEAKPALQKLIELYPDATGADSPYRDLAAAHRALGETNAERQVLTRFTAKDDQAPDAYLRLMELASATGDWPTVFTNASRYLAVNPLVAPPYRFLARASEETGKPEISIDAYRALLELDPSNPAEVHYHLARLLYPQQRTEARRHVLDALGEAPRYREALRLFQQMRQQRTNSVSSATAALEVSR